MATTVIQTAPPCSVMTFPSTISLGESIPPSAPHAVSVSLPAWQDNVDYEEGRPRVIDSMKTGYPRFFVHRSIQKLAGVCVERFAPDGAQCSYLFPSKRIADDCVAFLDSRSPSVSARAVAFDIPVRTADDLPTVIFAVLMDLDHKSVGKQFWQHTGDGISSRLAVHCLEQLGLAPLPMEITAEPPASPTSKQSIQRGYSRNRHYSKAGSGSQTSPESSLVLNPPSNVAPEENPDSSIYVEERYGRNLRATLSPLAKKALRRRIAGVLKEGANEGVSEESNRGVPTLHEDDVYLYPSGMSAIYHAHKVALAARVAEGGRLGRSICFGFPYTDTLKILEKWGPGCLHLGHGTDGDIDKLEEELARGRARGDAPYVSLFCEFPSNPLLRSPNLQRLRKLADEYDFRIVIDETIGTFYNVEVLPWADIVVSSLTKVFSGEANVIAGSLVLNPSSRGYSAHGAALEQQYEDTLYEEDAIFVERNSRDFRSRIDRIDANAEGLCDFLWQWRERTGDGRGVLKDLFYPKYQTEAIYRAHAKLDSSNGRPRYGGLFSVVFSNLRAAEIFYNSLPCCKGPSLGTNFTLASPYSLLAHYTELPWAAKWGVEASLVRVSTGLEPLPTLIAWFETALREAEGAAALRTSARS